MKGTTLKNAPLVEAIFEIKWQLQEKQPGFLSDPHYSLLIGSMYEKLRERYPVHQPLPVASIPNEMMAYVPQHRLRPGQDQWPLIQIGPGIFTVNETTGYTWADFRERIIESVDTLFQVYPKEQNLKTQGLVLRYINAITFDFERDDIFEFLKTQLKIDISPPAALFENTPVKQKPLGLDYRFSFECTKPKSVINLRLAKGSKNKQDALIWETIVDTRAEDIPKQPKNLKPWLEEAHEVIENWFFKLIKGNLESRFA